MPDRLQGKYYTTLEIEASDEFEEKRSLFIGAAKPVKTPEQANEFIAAKKKEFSDATHNVFAYILGDGTTARYSDDGEPQGTAGMPVLEVIRKSGVTDAAVVVTRYFGGILLGTGGLIRAYSKSAKLALEAAHIITYEKYIVRKLSCSYSDYQLIKSELEKSCAIVDDTSFSDSVSVTYAVKSGDDEILCERMCDLSSGKVIPESAGERYDYR